METASMVSPFPSPGDGTQHVYYTYFEASTDPELHGLDCNPDSASTQASIAACFRQILELVGVDPGREGLQKTPDRYAKAMLELTRGYSQTLKDVVNDAIFHVDTDYDEFQVNTDDLVMVCDIDISSLCEHHVLPFMGKVSVILAALGPTEVMI